MMEKLVKILMFISLVFFMDSTVNAKGKNDIDYEVYVHEITRSFAKEMNKELKLFYVGEGGKMPKDVEEIAMKFIAYQRATIDQARKLEVEVTEKLLKKVNEHEKIRPFLREYPFNSGRIKIMIGFEKPNNTRYSDGSVAFIFQARNKLYYDKADKNEKLMDLYEEPYEEAYKIVMGSSEKHNK